MANSFLPQDENTLEILPQDTDTVTETQTAAEITTTEENYTIPPIEEPQENEHFLEEDQTPLEEDILDDDPPTLIPATVTQNIPITPVKAIPNPRDPLTLQIEKILEADLADVFTALTPVQKQQFKIRGEETAHKIRQIITGTRIKIGKIIKIIFDWLKILPGINRFFLEQEAKIKADKIIALSLHQKYIS